MIAVGGVLQWFGSWICMRSTLTPLGFVLVDLDSTLSGLVKSLVLASHYKGLLAIRLFERFLLILENPPFK